MEEQIKKYLTDILTSIAHIEQFTEELTTFFEYESNLLIKRAVERELEIVGEAMSRILKTEEAVEIEHSRRIVDLRNRIIHGYDSVDDGVVWGILKIHLPKLKEEVQTLMQ